MRPPATGPHAVALQQVLGAAWPGQESPETIDQLDLALRLARANQVEGALARQYPQLLGYELRRVEQATAAFESAVTEAAGILRAHGIDPVLIKYVPGADHEYSNFDLVVGTQLDEAVAALAGWGVRVPGHPLEQTKIFVKPPTGPMAHLHQAACWWDIPAVDGTTLLARARDNGRWLVPAPVDELRIWVAHALFQNLSADLSELLAMRPLLRPELVEEAALSCRSEGWERGFRLAVGTISDVVAALDGGEVVPVPVALPVGASVALHEHVRHLVRSGRGTAAAREAGLRVPLLLAKARRVRRSRAGR